MADFQQPMLLGSVSDSDCRHPLHSLTRFRWWILVFTNILFILVGQSTAVLLSRYYYDNGGNSKWMDALLQTVAFPILFIPYVFLRDSSTPLPPSQPSIPALAAICFVIGALIACDGMLYSYALLYLSASTYSLISASQLAFMAIFAFFINNQKITVLILNSTVLLSLSASLLAVNKEDSFKDPAGALNKNYTLGIFIALGDAAMYSLVLSLIQLTFHKVLKKESITVVLEMQMYTAAVAASLTLIGLFVSGEWRNLPGDMRGYSAGEVSYVMTLVGTAVAWQLALLGSNGLIFVVSSLFSNVINMLALAVVPFASLVVFHDKIKGVKIIAMLAAFWGCASYMYQNYLDDKNARRKNSNGGDSTDIGRLE